MICKKDTEVEVLEKGEGPLGSWRPARILSGNGHTYAVKYDSCVLEAAVLRNKVPRKALRPRPPPVEVKSWACSDLVEVYDDGSWKIAEVLRTLDSNMVVARLRGSSKEIVSPLFLLRMPQIWKDNHWIPLQKDSVKCKYLDVKTLSKKRNLSCQIPCLSVVEKKCKRVDRHAEKYDDSVDQWYQKSLGSLKKKSWECRSPVHPNSGTLGKKKQIKKKGRCYKLAEKNLTNQLFEKLNLNGAAWQRNRKTLCTTVFVRSKLTTKCRSGSPFGLVVRSDRVVSDSLSKKIFYLCYLDDHSGVIINT